jgi:hypothetical protein
MADHIIASRSGRFLGRIRNSSILQFANKSENLNAERSTLIGALHPPPSCGNWMNWSFIRIGDNYQFVVREWELSRWKNRTFFGVAGLDFKLMDFREIFGNEVEDSRLIRWGKRIYVISSRVDWGALMIAQLESSNLSVVQSSIRRLIYSQQRPWEKNWSPFIYNDRLMLIYSGNPHVILECDADTGTCRKLASSYVDNLPWDVASFGEICGGSPAVKTSRGFLTFFHSRLEVERKYRMGAYIFRAQPPFDILCMSQQPLEVSGQRATRVWHDVLFPSGLIVDNDEAFVSYGDNDTESRALRIIVSNIDFKPVFSVQF